MQASPITEDGPMHAFKPRHSVLYICILSPRQNRVKCEHSTLDGMDLNMHMTHDWMGQMSCLDLRWKPGSPKTEWVEGELYAINWLETEWSQLWSLDSWQHWVQCAYLTWQSPMRWDRTKCNVYTQHKYSAHIQWCSTLGHVCTLNSVPSQVKWQCWLMSVSG